MKTFVPKKESIEKKWYLVDANGKTLGHIATKIAAILKGKHKPAYTPHLDTGDFVVVINAEKVGFTGKKLTDKIYYHHTMYPEGLRAKPAGKLLKEQPVKVLKKAVWGMLPKDRLGRDIFKKLKVYTGDKHPHKAQMPQELKNI